VGHEYQVVVGDGLEVRVAEDLEPAKVSEVLRALENSGVDLALWHSAHLALQWHGEEL